MKEPEDLYADIIHLPHHVSVRHLGMPLADRAAQFSPFAALTGFDSTIAETGRLTDTCAELEEDGRAALNERLQRLAQVIHTQPEVTLTYFRPDARKSGGAYVRFTGTVKKLDPYERTVVFTDRTAIPIERIYALDMPGI